MIVWDYIISNLWPKLVILAAFIAVAERIWKPVRFVGSATKNTYKFAKRFVGSVEHIENMRTDVSQIKEQVGTHEIALKFIQKEFNPNGGSSMTDKINQINLQLHKVAQKHRVDMEMSHHGIFQCDRDGNISYVNKTLANALGVTKEDFLGKNWENYIASPEFREKMYDALKSGRDLSVHANFLDIDGKQLRTKVAATPFDEGYTAYVEFLNPKIKLK